MRLVHFCWSGKGNVNTDFKPFANSLHHESRSRLPDAKLSTNVHARSALNARAQNIKSDDPLLRTDLAALHGRALPHREVAAAITAAVWHRLSVLDFDSVSGLAIRAKATVRPALRLGPLLGDIVVRKNLQMNGLSG